jgi:hypothetical protein
MVACAFMKSPVAAALRQQAGPPDVVTIPGGRCQRAKRILAASAATAVVRRLAGAMAGAQLQASALTARLQLY